LIGHNHPMHLDGSILLFLWLSLPGSRSWTSTRVCHRRHGAGPALSQGASRETETETANDNDNDNANANETAIPIAIPIAIAIADQEKKFKIVTCMSTSCSKKRESLGMDSLSTFGALYSRAADSCVAVEEGPCVGSCRKGPCVAIEHDDFLGTVALEGMTPEEFSSDAFQNVVTEEDADRVWSCVENAVKIMVEAEEEEMED